MQLPSDYLDVVKAGAAALREIGVQLRAVAERSPNTPELWLSVRDYEGLAARLADPDDWEWRHGFADLLLSPQDFGVLDELLSEDPTGPALLPAARRVAVARLREFLTQYDSREFEFEDPAA